ncbi:hypothetical protein, partial [Ruminococcus sp.]|uniref:hypothetical protein n=1 Tax=Ruminococcus sp. TaxID=41978 RepID=UPI0025E2DE2C
MFARWEIYGNLRANAVRPYIFTARKTLFQRQIFFSQHDFAVPETLQNPTVGADIIRPHFMFAIGSIF